MIIKMGLQFLPRRIRRSKAAGITAYEEQMRPTAALCLALCAHFSSEGPQGCCRQVSPSPQVWACFALSATFRQQTEDLTRGPHGLADLEYRLHSVSNTPQGRTYRPEFLKFSVFWRSLMHNLLGLIRKLMS